MSPLKCLIPLFLLMTAFSGSSNAQTSVTAYKTTYCVEVKYEMWRNGISYWATEYETSNYAEANLMFELFDAAFENGSLCSILGCGFDWIIVDVRLRTKREWYTLAEPNYLSLPLLYNRR